MSEQDEMHGQEKRKVGGASQWCLNAAQNVLAQVPDARINQLQTRQGQYDSVKMGLLVQ
jgi:hypothetical protein